METTCRPYRFRKNNTQRALYVAAEIRAEAMMLETISIRERIQPIAARQMMAACAAMGL